MPQVRDLAEFPELAPTSATSWLDRLAASWNSAGLTGQIENGETEWDASLSNGWSADVEDSAGVKVVKTLIHLQWADEPGGIFLRTFGVSWRLLR